MARGRHRRRSRYSVAALSGNHRRAVVAAGVVAALATGGTAAYAYWSASGNGAGTIQAITAATLTVTAAVTPVADLYPGKTSDLTFRISNTNGYPVSLTKLTAISV